MTLDASQLPDDVAALKAAVLAMQERCLAADARALQAEAEAARELAVNSSADALISHLRLEIEKLRRQLYGVRSEHKTRLLNQMELQLEELEASATEDELAAEQAAAKSATLVHPFARQRPSRKPFPVHLPRERVVVLAPESCPCCGSDRLSKLGEDITETLEIIPRQWKVIQTVRERFSCRDCEKISQPPAPFHVTPRGFVGPNLLATILHDKFGQHQPLNRQSERFAREGIDLGVSTLADQVGAAAMVLRPLHDLITAHVMAAARLHGDDTTVPILAKGKTDTGRAWVYVRDDQPFGGNAAPAALFHASRDRRGEHPQRHLASYSGILQADAYGGYNELYKPGRGPGPIKPALCWAHARRKFFELADISASRRRPGNGYSGNAPPISPIALDAVRRIDLIFDIEREINGMPPETRLAALQERSKALVAELEDWMRAERARLSRSSPVARALDYMLTRWNGLPMFSPVSPTCRRIACRNSCHGTGSGCRYSIKWRDDSYQHCPTQSHTRSRQTPDPAPDRGAADDHARSPPSRPAGYPGLDQHASL